MKSLQPLTQAPMRRTSLVTVTERWTHAKQSKVELACRYSLERGASPSDYKKLSQPTP